MLTTTVREARINLSKLLKRVEQGENIIIRNRSTPVARIVPYRQVAEKDFPDLSVFRQKMLMAHAVKRSKTEKLIRADREERG